MVDFITDYSKPINFKREYQLFVELNELELSLPSELDVPTDKHTDRGVKG